MDNCNQVLRTERRCALRPRWRIIVGTRSPDGGIWLTESTYCAAHAAGLVRLGAVARGDLREIERAITDEDAKFSSDSLRAQLDEEYQRA